MPAKGIDGFDQHSGATAPSFKDGSMAFTPKHRLSIKNNPLCGITTLAWCRIMFQRRHQIEWGNYWPRLVAISLVSIFNTILAIIETLLFKTEIRSTRINERPVFILGHPRTGTTLLHGLLALDEDQFDVCSTFCAGFPSCFLWFEGIGKYLFSGAIDSTRPMDNMRLDFDLPQEDELATNLLSGGVSPYMPLFLMRQEAEFRPYYSFVDPEADCGGDGGGSGGGGPSHSSQRSRQGRSEGRGSAVSAARRTWTAAFLHLLRKLTLRGQRRRRRTRPFFSRVPGGSTGAGGLGDGTGGGGGPRLLLKSPVHTARIPLLLSLFPEAQFIYVHRHPHDVFASACHMADTTYWYTYLNTPSDAGITEFVLRQYEILWECYEEGRRHLAAANGGSPERQLVEVAYADLVADPVGAVQRIYAHFGWPGWEASAGGGAQAEGKGGGGGGTSSCGTVTGGGSGPQGVGKVHARLLEEAAPVAAYQRNQHAKLSPEILEVVNKRWGESIVRLGYTPAAHSTKVGFETRSEPAI